MSLDALKQQQPISVNPSPITGASVTNAISTTVHVGQTDNAPSVYGFEKSNNQHEEKKTKRNN